MIPISRSANIKVDNHFNDVFKSLSKRIKYVLKNGARVRGAKCTASIVNARFLKRLNTKPFLKKIITASPEEIDKIISEISSFVWGFPLLIILIGGGLYLLIISRFIPFKAIAPDLVLGVINSPERF